MVGAPDAVPDLDGTGSPDRDRGVSKVLPCRSPSHTTERAGPHSAVEKVEVTKQASGLTSY